MPSRRSHPSGSGTVQAQAQPFSSDGRPWLRAAEILLRRLWPERKGRSVEVALPDAVSPADLVPALSAVVAAVGRGELRPEEAQAMCAVLEVQRRAIETAELEARVAALEGCVPDAPAGTSAESGR